MINLKHLLHLLQVKSSSYVDYNSNNKLLKIKNGLIKLLQGEDFNMILNCKRVIVYLEISQAFTWVHSEELQNLSKWSKYI